MSEIRPWSFNKGRIYFSLHLKRMKLITYHTTIAKPLHATRIRGSFVLWLVYDILNIRSFLWIERREVRNYRLASKVDFEKFTMKNRNTQSNKLCVHNLSVSTLIRPIFWDKGNSTNIQILSRNKYQRTYDGSHDVHLEIYQSGIRVCNRSQKRKNYLEFRI